MDAQENIKLPVIDFSPYNSTSMSSEVSMLSPTTLPAKVVAEVQQMRDANARRRIRGKQPFRRRTVEMDNFQDPQVVRFRRITGSNVKSDNKMEA